MKDNKNAVEEVKSNEETSNGDNYSEDGDNDNELKGIEDLDKSG